MILGMTFNKIKKIKNRSMACDLKWGILKRNCGYGGRKSSPREKCRNMVRKWSIQGAQQHFNNISNANSWKADKL